MTENNKDLAIGRLRGIVESAMDAIISIDDEQRIVIFNAAAERMFACPAERAVGKTLDIFIPPRHRQAHQGHIVHFGRTGVTSRSMKRPGTLTGLRQNGEEFPLEATISQFEQDGRKYYTAIVRDITERKAIEERLRAAVTAAQEAQQIRQDFMAVVSHELRTPLNAIIGYADLISLDIPARCPDPIRGQVERIDAAARHLLTLIDEILLFSRIEAGREEVDLEELSVTSIVADAMVMVEPLARQKDLALSVRHDPALTTLRSDGRKLTQVLVNLLANAVKFTDRGEITLECARSGSHATFTVRDTGVGIEPENLDRIFDEFWRADRGLSRKNQGTGLGLTVVKRLVHLLGGMITVSSQPGEGSAFTVRIPVARDRTSTGMPTPA